MKNGFSFCVCTYNSSDTMKSCLESVRSLSPNERIIVVDHESSDDTREIAVRYKADVFMENKGLGYARQMCFDLTETEYLVFVDSDVEVLRNDLLTLSTKAIETQGTGAVVGMSVGHSLPYGLPASLLVLRERDFQGRIIPDYIDARETYFIQKRLDEKGLSTVYVQDAIIHRSQFREFKPEWEGANTRILPSSMLKELAFAFKVVLLMSLNSRSAKNIAYIPIFYLKFLDGFSNPTRWLKLDREGKGAN